VRVTLATAPAKKRRRRVRNTNMRRDVSYVSGTVDVAASLLRSSRSVPLLRNRPRCLTGPETGDNGVENVESDSAVCVRDRERGCGAGLGLPHHMGGFGISVVALRYVGSRAPAGLINSIVPR
jgi:hypothetical protein